MSKHPVPKKKTSQSRRHKRYGSFKTKNLKRFSNLLKLVPCSNCKSRVPAHTACPECGQYKGLQIIDKQKQIDKITKIKA